MFHGVAISNDSLVDVDDLLYRAPQSCCNEQPSNSNPALHDQALLCVTDLVDCCESPPVGTWYYPDGRVVELDNGGNSEFQANRGPNQVINERQFYGSVRLWRRYSRPPERGRFRCELPSAANSMDSQVVYANIGRFVIYK